jgi:hypothetical protein
MRTTVAIDEDVLCDLKQQAEREGVSLARLINRVLRQGLRFEQQTRKPPRRYREKTFRMGPPKADLTKALALAASLEDDEVREELARRK